MKIVLAFFWLVLLCGCTRSPEPATAPAAEDAVASGGAAATDSTLANGSTSKAEPEAPVPQPESVESATVLSAAERVPAFLTAYQSQMFRGLPSPDQAAALAEHFSPRLNGLFRDALAGQQSYKARFPTDKPPMIDGDIFSSLFEGATTGTVETVEASGDTAVVRVKYVYSEPDTGKVIETWPDRFLLVREGEGWLIDDVEYLGGWDFAPRGKLSAALAETAALRE